MSEPFEIDNPENKSAPKGRFRFSKGFIPFVVLIVVVVGSFWISFELGMRVLNSGSENANKIIPSEIPEVPPEIAKLQTNKMKPVKPPLNVVKTIAAKSVSTVRPAKKTLRIGKYSYYKVQAGYFNSRGDANDLAEKLTGDGVDTYIKKVGAGWRVQAGAYKTKSSAIVMQNLLKEKGYDSKLVVE